MQAPKETICESRVLYTLGKPPRYEQFPEPSGGEGEVIVHVRAAALKPVDKQMAEGSHYASPRKLPAVVGVDGVGRLEDDTRVYFGGPRPPYGAMAQHTVVSRPRCFPLPEDIDDVTAAALVNPGLSAWLTLTWRARLAPGETVLILGATGITGKLAVQIAKLLGAGRVIAAGRNEEVLGTLHEPRRRRDPPPQQTQSGPQRSVRPRSRERGLQRHHRLSVGPTD